MENKIQPLFEMGNKKTYTIDTKETKIQNPPAIAFFRNELKRENYDPHDLNAFMCLVGLSREVQWPIVLETEKDFLKFAKYGMYIFIKNYHKSIVIKVKYKPLKVMSIFGSQGPSFSFSGSYIYETTDKEILYKLIKINPMIIESLEENKQLSLNEIKDFLSQVNLELDKYSIPEENFISLKNENEPSQIDKIVKDTLAFSRIKDHPAIIDDSRCVVCGDKRDIKQRSFNFGGYTLILPICKICSEGERFIDFLRGIGFKIREATFEDIKKGFIYQASKYNKLKLKEIKDRTFYFDYEVEYELILRCISQSDYGYIFQRKGEKNPLIKCDSAKNHHKLIFMHDHIHRNYLSKKHVEPSFYFGSPIVDLKYVIEEIKKFIEHKKTVVDSKSINEPKNNTQL
ncbi:hypothetical protein KY347_04050 [Candidatus Woesearchaeota archaeon]|nr:hypothetical protein [Candidatus Woesearchaeota archaeon]